MSLAQTTDGFLWIGTDVGLYRFDGISFEPYRLPPGYLPFSKVTALLATPDGGLWVGYRAAVAFVLNGKSQVYTEKQGLPYGLVWSLARTEDGTIWAGVVGGFARLHDGQWHKVRSEWNYPENTAGSVFVDRQGTLWVTTGTGVRYLPRGDTKFHPLELDNLGSAGRIRQGPDGAPWLARPGQDVIVALSSSSKSGANQNTGSARLDQIQIGAWDFLMDRDGSLWAAGEGITRVTATMLADLGVVAKAAKSSDVLSEKDGLSGTDANVILEDREGNIWVGTNTGLDRFRNRNAIQVDDGKDYATLVAGVGADVWLGPNDSREFFTRAQDGSNLTNVHLPVLTSFIDRNGTYWFSTYKFSSQFEQGFWSFQNGKLNSVPGPAGIPHPRIKRILSDLDGKLWLAVSGYGEYTLKDGVWSFVPVFQGKDADLSPDFQFMDAQGRVWLSYYARGTLALIQNGQPTFFTSNKGLDVGVPIVGAARGYQTWVTGTAGTAFFDGKRFHNIRGVDGADFANMSEVLPTDKNGLWLKGTEGVIQIAQTEIDRVLRGETSTVAYRTFDGSTDFTRPLVSPALDISPAAVEAGDGKLWFLSQGGVSSIDPSHLFKNELAPPVTIRSITAGGINYPAEQALRLPANTKNLTIDYTALSLTFSERNQFRYQLVGFDKDWQEAKTRRQAYYTNLPPGTYSFHVIASNNDGVWNDTGATEVFTIPPTFIQTIWFRLICAAACGCILLLCFLWRVRLVEERVRAHLSERLVERERIARELHDTLLQGFQGLVLRFQAAALTIPAQEPARGMMETALSGADDVITEGRNRVRDLRIGEAEPLTLEEQLQTAGAELSVGQHASFMLVIRGGSRRLHQVVCEEAYRTAREALINAFLHSKANSIEAELVYAKNSVVVRIHDDGVGIDQEVIRSGKVGHFGLYGMKERAAKINATLRIHIRHTGGTTVELTIPARIAYAPESKGRLAASFSRLLSWFRPMEF